MSNYKLYKQEGKLKEQPAVEKPDVKIIHFSDYQQAIEDYDYHLSSLKEYIIEPGDWKEFGEEAEVKEGEFVIKEINSHALKFEPFDKPEYAAHPVQKPSAKEKIEDRWFHYVIYDHPSDYPDDFVVRRFEITKEGALPESKIFMNRKFLTDIREQLKMIGLYPIPRHLQDDPVIVETWI